MITLPKWLDVFLKDSSITVWEEKKKVVREVLREEREREREVKREEEEPRWGGWRDG